MRGIPAFRLSPKVLSIFFLLSAIPALRAAETGWHAGRIVSVQKDVNTKTLYWIVNTPITQDEITYRVEVHVGKTLLQGSYEPSKAQGDPPQEWTADYPLNVKVVGSDLYLLSAEGEQFRLHIYKRSPAKPMKPVTQEELAKMAATPPATENLPIGIGSAPAAPSRTAEPAAATPSTTVASPAPSLPPGGLVSVRTTPYLSEVFVDGNDMGYSPSKLNLTPGKHTVKLVKSGYKDWVKEITVTAGSEQLIDATLEGK